jgi:hypothetical protein
MEHRNCVLVRRMILLKIFDTAGCQRLTPIITAIQEVTEIWRIMVQDQAGKKFMRPSMPTNSRA